MQTYAPDPPPPPDPPPSDAPGKDCDDHGPYGDDECPKCSCGAPATWEVPFSTDPLYEYFCDACFRPTHYRGDPIGAPLATVAYAQTLQSQAIEARLTVCGYCAGVHHVQKCPELTARLFAPALEWSDPDLGRELCRMRWQRYKAFVALLLSVPSAHLVIYAASYQAFIRSHAPDSDMTISQVLEAWAKDMRRGGDRGPKALAEAA